mmetsp:Transcript_104768/g.249465  ORF Transcript_104768/g.249465 Transcript_104768/m.249465 type:complete len:213 (-) Transcript_104768:19-657(-)
MALAPRRLGPRHAALARALAGYGHGPLMHSLVHALCTLHACTRAPHHVPALSGHRRRRDSSWRLLLCAAASAAPCLPATGEAFGAVIVAVDLSERGLHGKAAITNSTKQVFLRSDFEDASLSGSSLWQYEVPRVPFRLAPDEELHRLRGRGGHVAPDEDQREREALLGLLHTGGIYPGTQVLHNLVAAASRQSRFQEREEHEPVHGEAGVKS